MDALTGAPAAYPVPPPGPGAVPRLPGQASDAATSAPDGPHRGVAGDLPSLNRPVGCTARGQRSEPVSARIADPHKKTADDFAEYGRRLAHVQAETAMLEERWLQLQTDLETLQAGA